LSRPSSPRASTRSLPRRSFSQDAAVVGRSVWPGRWLRSETDRGESSTSISELVRKEFLMRVSTSLVQGETEFRFRHVLVRDVAYEQILRVRRAEMHRRAAEGSSR
jgi:hypothetical protein